MGLVVGYICVLFAKFLNVTNPYFGILGVASTTMLLLALSNSFDWRSLTWWIRSLAVTFICLLITSPQLYFAWTVSVSEAKSATEAQLQRNVDIASGEHQQPAISITNIGRGN